MAHPHPPPPNPTTLSPKMSRSPARVSLKLGYIILYQVNLSNRTRMRMTEVGEPKCFILASKSSLPPALHLLLFKASSHLQRRCTSSMRLTQAPRSRSRQSGSSRITDEQISDLVSKLQDLLPEARLRGNDRVPSSRVLQETCTYIRSLHREVDDLSERLSELLATSDMSSAQAAIIRSLLM
ncbi:uncharacterized protein LOC123449567 isoform X3 [Hordeum vulgare subsp. vulgare]|uniref:uncharacterized protein LOC123449567 isoform X3 n=1 Tax=Hordeum vulgare subsp. vulgare TaxID=112509 RepID=UPI001D1A5643|nr:uncharacterized protein LOC123449567 isoform X3 [Hordeum vulgare subsp. vulgare]